MSEEQYYELKAKVEIADEMFGDLPDGAYWAACEEQGVGMDEQAAILDYEEAHRDEE